MQVYLYRGTGRIFAVTATDSVATLPQRYGPWTSFKSIEITRGQAQPGLHVEECLDDIERYGIHVTDAHRRITDEAIG